MWLNIYATCYGWSFSPNYLCINLVLSSFYACSLQRFFFSLGFSHCSSKPRMKGRREIRWEDEKSIRTGGRHMMHSHPLPVWRKACYPQQNQYKLNVCVCVCQSVPLATRDREWPKMGSLTMLFEALPPLSRPDRWWVVQTHLISIVLRIRKGEPQPRVHVPLGSALTFFIGFLIWILSVTCPNH